MRAKGVRLGVGVQFGFWLSLLGVAAVGTTAFYAYSEARAMLLAAAKTRLVTATTVLGRRFSVALDEVVRDVTLLSRLEEVEGLAGEAHAAEPLQLRLAEIFADVLDLHPEYTQIRLIGAREFGRELVRVDRTDDGTARVTGSGLQEKGHFPYVYLTLEQPHGSFYLSDINLNLERGVQFGFERPTLRVATPVYSDPRSVFGLVVVNVDLDGFFAQLRADLPEEIELYLTNADGDYLMHPDSAKTFGFDRGRRVRIHDEFGEAASVLAGEVDSTVLESAGRVAAFVDAPFGKIAPDRHVLLGLAIPIDTAIRGIEPFGRRLALIVSGFSLLAVLLSFVLSKLLVRPLDRVVSAVNRFSRGEALGALPTGRGDEIGVLSRSFAAMAEQIGSHIETLRLNEENLNRILETAPSDMIVVARDDHRILFMNTSARTRFRRENTDGRFDLLDQGLDREEVENLDSELARTGKVEYVEHRFPMGDGEEFWGLLSMVEIEYRNRTAVLFSIIDITRRKEVEIELNRYRHRLEDLVEERTADMLEAQRESLRNERLAAIGQLTGTVSHELRNPLSTIRTSFEFLRRLLEIADPRVEKALERIDRNISRCDNIVQELLDYTRSRELELESTDLDPWIDQLLDEQEAPGPVRVERSLRSAATVAIDRLRMTQAIINVIQNACQAMSEAEPPTADPVLHVRSRAADGAVELEFEDNGPGIYPADRERIFEPLFSTRSFGVGLGLPLVKQVLERHGGRVEVHSSPGAGARVVLSLPGGK